MIQEIDIKDWVCVGQPTKLYEVPRNSVCSFTDDPAIPFWFNKIDGAYSLCQQLDGSIFHPAAWSDVLVWKMIKE